MMGATNPRKAAPGTIRGDLGIQFTENLVHGSDSLGVGRARDRHLLPGSVTTRRRLAGQPRRSRRDRCRCPVGLGTVRRGSDAMAATTRSASAATWRSTSAPPTP